MSFITLYSRKFLNYLVNHFEGKLNIEQTYVANGFLVSLLLFAVINPYISGYSTTGKDEYLIQQFLFHTTLFSVVFWQSIGCIRLAIKLFSRNVWFKFGSVVIVGLFLAYLSVASYLLYLATPVLYTAVEVIVFGDLKEKGKFEWFHKDKELSYEGEIYDGFYQDFKSQFLKHKDIKSIYLNSNGGYAGEALAAYRFLKDKDITTTSNYCASACTYIYLAGKRREAPSEAIFSFHTTSKLFLDESIWSERMNIYEVYQGANVKERFVSKLVTVPYEEFWEPSAHYLLGEGVVTKIVKYEYEIK